MPGTNFESDNEDFDSQDQSEAFDETNLIGDGDGAGGGRYGFSFDERRSVFEELPDVEDYTQAEGDEDDDRGRALDSADFDPDAIDTDDDEQDDELAYRAADAEREDDIDGLGPEDGFDDGRIARSEIEGLDEVRDADEAEGGEDDFTDFQSRAVSDEDLKALGYARDGVAADAHRRKP